MDQGHEAAVLWRMTRSPIIVLVIPTTYLPYIPRLNNILHDKLCDTHAAWLPQVAACSSS